MRLYLAYFNLVACDLVPFDSNFETECKLFTQHLVLDNDCWISRNIWKTKISLVTSNNLHVLYFWKWNSALFSPRSKNKKFTARKFLIFQETKALKKFLIFSQKRAFLIFQEIETLEKFLIFQEKKNIKKNIYI